LDVVNHLLEALFVGGIVFQGVRLLEAWGKF
jgi:hypothetical protein